MDLEDTQLPSPPPEADGSSSMYAGGSRHIKDSSSGSIAKTSSSTANSHVKRNTYGSTVNAGNKTVDPSDDLLIRIMAQRALIDLPDQNNIFHPDEVEDLKNVSSYLFCRLISRSSP